MSLAKANRGSTQQNYHVGSLVWVPEQAAQVSLRMAGVCVPQASDCHTMLHD